MRRWALIWAMLWCCGSASASIDTLFIEEGFERTEVVAPMQVFSDVSYQAHPEFIIDLMDLKGDQLRAKTIHYGYIKAAFWFRITIKNQSKLPKNLILSLDNPNIDSVSFFEQHIDGTKLLGIAGDHVPRSQWLMGSRQAAMPFQLEPGGSTTLLAKARNSYSGNMILPLVVWNSNHFHSYQEGYHLVWGTYFGFLLINIALAFSGILLLRASIFLWYGLFLIASLLYTGLSFGFAYQYFSGAYPMSNDVARTTTVILVSAFMFKFSQYFLKTKELSPLIHLLINICLAVQGVLLTASFFILDFLRTQFNSIFPWFLMLVLTGYVLVIFAAIHNRKQAPLRAKAFLLAYGFSLLGGGTLILTDLNVLPYNLFTLHAPWFGSAIEIVIFTGIMFYEFKLVGDQKIRLEKQVAEDQTNRLKEFFRGQEKERERIARDLHDNVAGSLVGARFLMPTPHKLQDKLDEKSLLSYERALHTLDRSIRDVRNLSHNLQPPAIDAYTLKYELERLLADHQAMEPKTLFHLTYKLEENLVNNDVAVAIFRVCQECLLNIFKHAFANSVHLMIESNENTVRIFVTDNGRGFNPADTIQGIGLNNIRSRLAFTKNLKTQIDSVPEKGTHVSISFEV